MSKRKATISRRASDPDAVEGGKRQVSTVTDNARRGARMSDVAKIAGVSAMTVSRALRNPNVVTPETLKKIDLAIKSVGYLPNRVAGNLSSKRSNIVGLIVPSLRNSLFSETIQGIADMIAPRFDLMIANSGYSLKGEEDAVVAFLSQRVCGIVLHNVKHTARTRQLIKESGIPCVETGNLTQTPIDISVGFSNRTAARDMTLYLISRGYRRIGFVSLPLKENDRALERRHGYMEALQQQGIACDESIMLETPPGLRSGGQAFNLLMQASPKVDAAFLTGDVLAIGALLEANSAGIRVPDDVAIAGSDDSELQALISPSLTSLRFPRYEIGRRAAGLIIDRIVNDSSGPVIMDLGFELIRRKSS